MTIVYGALCVLGLALAAWAHYALPAGTVMFPVPVRGALDLGRAAGDPIITVSPTTRGPYRWLRHPMYVGNIALVTGLGGLGGGIWTALALFTLAEMVMREWAYRERPGRIWP